MSAAWFSSSYSLFVLQTCDQLAFPKSDPEDFALLLKPDITLRMDSKVMEEEALPGFLGLLPGFSGVGEAWLTGKGEDADSCLELLASLRSCTVMRTLSTACSTAQHTA